MRARIVERPEQSPWSSYRYFINGSLDNDLIDIKKTLRYFAVGKRKAIKEYMSFVEAGLQKEDNPLDAVQANTILGNEAFVEKVQRFLRSRKQDDEIPDLKRLAKRLSVNSVINECRKYFNISRADLLRVSRENRERQTTIYLSKSLSGCTNGDVGSLFGIKASAVSRVLKRVETQLEEDRIFHQEIQKMKEALLSGKTHENGEPGPKV